MSIFTQFQYRFFGGGLALSGRISCIGTTAERSFLCLVWLSVWFSFIFFFCCVTTLTIPITGRTNAMATMMGTTAISHGDQQPGSIVYGKN